MVINAISAADRRDDVAAPIEYREGVAVFERAQPALLERDIRFYVKRRGIGVPGSRKGGLACDPILRRLGQRWPSLQAAAAEFRSAPPAPRRSTDPYSAK